MDPRDWSEAASEYSRQHDMVERVAITSGLLQRDRQTDWLTPTSTLRVSELEETVFSTG